MSWINSKLQKVKPSETLAVKAKAQELRAAGRVIHDLSTGEPDIDTPEHVKEGARRALIEGKTKYTAVAGIPELREEIAAKLRRENKLEVQTSQVIVTAGGKQALYSLFDSVLEAGDEVVIFAPYWVSYIPMIEMAGGRAVVVHPEPGAKLRIAPEQLSRALSAQTRAVVFNSPSNPAGVGYSRDELRAFGEVLRDYSRILVVSDEVYERTAYEHFSFCSFGDACPELQSRLVTINAFSKSYSMTGWRVGYAAGPREIIAALERHQSQSTSNACSIAQYAALAALRGDHGFVKEMNLNFSRRVARAAEILSGVPGVSIAAPPDGAFYLFLKYDAEALARAATPITSSVELVGTLLEKGGVAAVQGEAFGDESAFRISVAAADAVVEAGVTAIAKVMRELLK